MRRRIVVALGCLSATVLLTQIVTAPPSFAAGQSTQAAQVMHAKLEHSGQLLAALVTSDWASLGHHARALQDVTTKPGYISEGSVDVGVRLSEGGVISGSLDGSEKNRQAWLGGMGRNWVVSRRWRRIFKNRATPH